MRFKVGDKVRVREDLTLEEVGRVHDMLEFEGLEATVETVFDQAYHLTVDNHEWYWIDELLEPVEEETKMDNYYYADRVDEWVKWVARDSDGKLFGYRVLPTKGELGWTISEFDIIEINISFISNDPHYMNWIQWEDREPVKLSHDWWKKYNPNEDELEDVLDSPPEPDMIQSPPHYKQYSFEPIDIITEVVKEYPPEIGFHIGTTLKYLFRSPFKGKQKEDLAKSMYYLERAIKELTDE